MLFIESKIVISIIFIINGAFSFKLLNNYVDLCMKQTSAGKFKQFSPESEWQEFFCIQYRITSLQKVNDLQKTIALRKFENYNLKYGEILFRSLRKKGSALNTVQWCHLFGVSEFQSCLEELEESSYDTDDSVENLVSSEIIQDTNILESYRKDIPIQDSHNNDPNQSYHKNSSIRTALGDGERYSMYLSFFTNEPLKDDIISPLRFCSESCHDELQLADFKENHLFDNKQLISKKFKGKVPSNTLKHNTAVVMGGYADQYALHIMAYDSFEVLDEDTNESGFFWCKTLFKDYELFQT